MLVLFLRGVTDFDPLDDEDGMSDIDDDHYCQACGPAPASPGWPRTLQLHRLFAIDRLLVIDPHQAC